MAVEHDRDVDKVELGNGDSLSERLEELDIEDEDTCSTDEMRDRLGL